MSEISFPGIYCNHLNTLLNSPSLGDVHQIQELKVDSISMISISKDIFLELM
jgi:hypothetical protein